MRLCRTWQLGLGRIGTNTIGPNNVKFTTIFSFGHLGSLGASGPKRRPSNDLTWPGWRRAGRPPGEEPGPDLLSWACQRRWRQARSGLPRAQAQLGHPGPAGPGARSPGAEPESTPAERPQGAGRNLKLAWACQWAGPRGGRASLSAGQGSGRRELRTCRSALGLSLPRPMPKKGHAPKPTCGDSFSSSLIFRRNVPRSASSAERSAAWPWARTIHL